MKSVIKLTFLILLICSCGNGKVETIIPESVINKEKFSSILADVLVLEGYKSRIYKPRDSLKLSMRSYYKGVLEKHGTDKQTYDRTYLFYSEHPEIMYEVFQMAETKFKMKEDNLNDEKAQAKASDDEIILEDKDIDDDLDSTVVDSLVRTINDKKSKNKLLNFGKK